ncbi:hypothetical protein ACIBFB_07240 [Nocardiopsis sp. NPDC050513]|uniref:hypothetical protein n=1 Tax=Nocardiopsis sp. NPDC050513 TaxID=3364338 RepID=UPI00379C14F4
MADDDGSGIRGTEDIARMSPRELSARRRNAQRDSPREVAAREKRDRESESRHRRADLESRLRNIGENSPGRGR